MMSCGRHENSGLGLAWEMLAIGQGLAIADEQTTKSKIQELNQTIMQTTKEQVKASVDMALAVADAIRELGEVPSGHLYARLMGHMDIDAYSQMIELLKDAKVITVTNHLIKWVGPARKSSDQEVKQ